MPPIPEPNRNSSAATLNGATDGNGVPATPEQPDGLGRPVVDQKVRGAVGVDVVQSNGVRVRRDVDAERRVIPALEGPSGDPEEQRDMVRLVVCDCQVAKPVLVEIRDCQVLTPPPPSLPDAPRRCAAIPATRGTFPRQPTAPGRTS